MLNYCLVSSKKHIPEVFHPLMTEGDSPILDFYPEDFQIDMNGKKMIWQGVAILPFIDEKRLLEAMETKYHGLSAEEINRNRWGSNVLFVTDAHPLYPTMEGLYGKRKTNDVRIFLCSVVNFFNANKFPARSY